MKWKDRRLPSGCSHVCSTKPRHPWFSVHPCAHSRNLCSFQRHPSRTGTLWSSVGKEETVWENCVLGTDLPLPWILPQSLYVEVAKSMTLGPDCLRCLAQRVRWPRFHPQRTFSKVQPGSRFGGHCFGFETANTCQKDPVF